MLPTSFGRHTISRVTKRLALACLASGTLAVAGATQCMNCTAPGTFIGNGDDVVFPTHFPLGFNYPMAPGAGGVPGITWSHFRVSTNGWLMLTNGVLSTGIPGPTDFGSAASLRGGAGSFPRIAPYWGDLDLDSFNTAGVYYKQIAASGSVPASCAICWVNANDWSASTILPVKTFQAQIYANGQIVFRYSRMKVDRGGAKIVGVSWGNANLPGFVAQVPLTSGPPNARFQPRMYKAYPVGPFGPQLRSLTFNQITPSTGHGWLQHVSCYIPGGFFWQFGKGAPLYSDSFYQAFPSALEATIALQGRSLSLIATGSEYQALGGDASSYVPPSGSATVLALGDDSEVAVALSSPFPTAAGPQSTLRVHANGVVSWGAGAQTFPGSTSRVPMPSGLLDAANGGVWSWHNYNPAEAGSGQVKYEEVAGVAYVTWDGVESDSSPDGANPSTLQFQFDLTTGDVRLVWLLVDGDDSSEFGSGHLIGYSPGGPSADAGSVDLALALPLQTQPTNLDGAPDPVSTPSVGTTVSLDTINVPEFSPGSGLFLGIQALSFGQVPGGLELGFLGAPGVSMYLSTLGQTIAVLGTSSTQSVAFVVPPGVPPGTEVFAQTFALVPALNAFGLAASNGLQIYVSDF
jgi:hypothetical protein